LCVSDGAATVKLTKDEHAPEKSPELIGIGKWNAAADADVFCRVLLEEVPDDPNESTKHEPKDDTARGVELVEKLLCAEHAKGKRGHHAEFTDGEESDEAKRVHAREISLAVWNVHRSPKKTSPKGGENAPGGICPGGMRSRRRDRKDGRSGAHDERTTKDAEPATETGAAELIEKKKAPKDSEERIRIPERKSDAEADIANGVNRKCVRDGPETTGKNRPNNEVRSAACVCSNGLGAEEERWETPTRKENSNDHEKRDDHR